MSHAPVLVDSGFLVALGIRRDPRHQAARQWLQTNGSPLLTPTPVVTESCYFLSPKAKAALLRWIADGKRLRLIDIPPAAHGAIAAIVEKYATRDPDFTDAALIWAADAVRCARILTVDQSDFEVYRLKGSKRFELIDWHSARA
jgi:predicted nucleic acid-binding protein